jgi:DHA1 family tetracycline resistance protein-like MFS transporter
MIAIATVLLLGYIAQQSLMNVYVIYADYRYHWTDRTVGFSLATIGICTAIYGALLVKPIVAKIGERGAMTIGLIGGAIGYSMFGFSKTGVLFWCGIPLLNMMSFTWPGAQSLLSRQTSPSEQGQLQGAINSLRGIAGLLGPSFFTYIFSVSISTGVHIPGSPFYAAAAMLLVSLALAQHAARKPTAVIPS